MTHPAHPEGTGLHAHNDYQVNLKTELRMRLDDMVPRRTGSAQHGVCLTVVSRAWHDCAIDVGLASN